jgi:hypothetical protein
MFNVKKIAWLLMALMLVGVASCGGNKPTADPSLAFTQAWQTVEVAQTQTAQFASPTPSFTNTPEASATQESATKTPAPTNTPLITSTLMPGTPSPTVFSLATSAFTSTPFTACDNANFVSDVTIPDGTEIAAGSTFEKTWQFKNVGPCTWETTYSMVFSYVTDNGKNGVFQPPAAVNFPAKVLPGETMDITVSLTAPTVAGTYTAWFVLKNAQGYNIPIVNSNSFEFYVSFVVK